MSITTRAALKAQFKTGAIPTSQDFFNLIDSTLVRRDDAFFGKWAAGICYYEGDVVIYNNALYTCTPAGDKPCGCDGTDNNTGKADKSKGHCSTDNPEIDCTNWKMLDIDASDEDWEIVRNEDKVPIIMYAKVFGKIGMGTEDPKARVHIHVDELKSDFLFSPDNAQSPEFVIQQTGGDNTQSLSEKLADDKAVFTTNTEGFLFTTTTPPPVPLEGEENAPKEAINVKPVFITTPDAGAAVGIGTTAPEAAVDIQNQASARLLLNPVQAVIPQAVWIHKGEYGQQSYLNTALDGNASTFTTNAPEGFYFRKGIEDTKNYLKNIGQPASETLVSIKQDGRVGIGTETPVTNVEITKANSAGAFLMCLDNTNPGFSIINNRPNNEKRNYMLLGADNDWGAFLTDASKGFVFKKGGEYGNGNELEINQGDDLVTISAEGKTIIGGLTPTGFDLNVKGKARAFGLYLDTDVRKVSNPVKLGNVIDKVKKLNPVTFTFNQKANCPPTEAQIGFLPHQVEEFFPELVNTDGDGTQTLAYANMVAVLTKAIQEQQETIAALQKRLDALEGK